MVRKKDGKDPFKYLDNFFTDDAKLANLFNVLVREIFNNMEDTGERSSFVYGINMKVDKDGEPVVEQFGNVKKMPDGTRVMEEREPLVDVIKKRNEVVVIAEIPGVEKSDIRIIAKPSEIEIVANSREQGRNYFKRVSLPKKIIPKTGSATYNNGIIEISVRTGIDSESVGRISIK